VEQANALLRASYRMPAVQDNPPAPGPCN